MEWTEDHDVIFLREILPIDLFSLKKERLQGKKGENRSEKN